VNEFAEESASVADKVAITEPDEISSANVGVDKPILVGELSFISFTYTVKAFW